jgi:succinyl-diaminopimelate desuccinylase
MGAHVINRQDVLQKIDDERIVDLVSQLVRIPSRNPPGDEKGCAEYIMRKLKEWGFGVQVIPEPFPDRPQVVATCEGTERRPTLVLNGHMDVVPEGNVRKWSVDPFGGVVRGGRVYGRGACDMKGGIATMLMAAKAIKDSGIKLRGNLILQFVIGEETGEPGTRHLLVERAIGGDFGIVLEPTNLRVATSEKGVAWFQVVVEGKPAHAGTPERGNNAILRASRMVTLLEKYNRTISKRRHPLLGRATCSVTMIEGGTKENVIPESCKLTIDRRFLPNETAAGIEKELDRIFLGESNLKYRLERKIVYEPFEIPAQSKIAQSLRKGMKDLTGTAPKTFGMPVGTDARNFVNDARIPAVSWGPGDIKVAHSFDEFVEIDQLVTSTKVLCLAILDLLA